MDATSAALVDTFVAAYRSTVEARLRSIGPPAGWDGALADGEEWLRAELTVLVTQPHRLQRRGPLEIFQEAIKFPTAALAAAGVDPVHRDGAAAAALPGDVYDLAPASSQELGSAAWRAHLEWGARRAAAFRPAVLWLGGGLIDRARIEEAVRSAGLRFEARPPADFDLEAVRPVVLALVDLEAPSAAAAIVSLAGAAVKVVAYGPHTGGEALQRARLAGAADAMARSRFFTRLPDLLPRRV